MPTISILIALAALAALVSVILLYRSQLRRHVNLDELRGRLRPIDVKAFRNLIDEREEEFLRERLSASEFRSIHRERMLAATEYVRCSAHNAGILLQLADAAKTDSDPAVVEAALTLQETAFEVRMQAYRALPRFYVRMLLPGINTVPQSLVETCDRLSRQAVILGCLRPPERAVPVR